MRQIMFQTEGSANLMYGEVEDGVALTTGTPVMINNVWSYGVMEIPTAEGIGLMPHIIPLGPESSGTTICAKLSMFFGLSPEGTEKMNALLRMAEERSTVNRARRAGLTLAGGTNGFAKGQDFRAANPKLQP
jgi:hypothetical protein